MMAAAELAGFELRRYRRLVLEQIPEGLRPLSPLHAEERAAEARESDDQADELEEAPCPG